MILKLLRKRVAKSEPLRKFVGYRLAATGLFDSWMLQYPLSQALKERIENVLAAPDNARIPRVANAGVLKRGIQTMHNGLNVYAGSYYGPEFSQMFLHSKGVHEPQEEFAFQEVLKQIAPGGTMIEMGAYWSFYSMWFNKAIPAAKNLMIEPEALNLAHGKRHFRLNNMKGVFDRGYVGKEFIDASVPTYSLDYLIAKYRLSSIQILHSDIQGFELDMLEGASESFKNDLIDYTFISTHSNDLHYACIEKLKAYNHQIICEADLDTSYAYDGLILSCSPRLPKPEIFISKRGV